MNIKELEKTLWLTAKRLRINTDAVTHVHVVLGLIFLKYITDAFNKVHENVLKGEADSAVLNSASPEKSLSQDSFYLPEKTQWAFLQSNAHRPDIGTRVDDAINTIEKINENLEGILPKNYANPDLDKSALGELVSLIGSIGLKKQGQEKKYLFGQVFENLLKRFAESEGKNTAYFYTQPNIAKLVAEMLEPYKGRIYDGCCGLGEMFLQSERFIKEHHGKTNNQIFYGQDANDIIVKIAKMNLAIHGIDADLQCGNTLINDYHPRLEADFILAQPPFNMRDWQGEQLHNDNRWKYGVPPEGNATYAWLQHFISKLSPTGIAGIVLPGNSMYSKTGKEGEIRKNLIEAKLVDCMVALPSKLFYGTDIPACLWLLTKNKTNNRYTNADNEILFIDAGKLGTTVSGRNRELTNEDISLISKTYHRWRNINGDYIDIKGFCKAVSIEEVRKSGYVLTPEKYVANIRVKKALFALLPIILLGAFYFFIFKNGSLTSRSATRDTAIIVQSKPVKDLVQPQKKLSKPVKTKVKDDSVKMNTHSDTNAPENKPIEISPSVAQTSSSKEATPPVTKTSPPKEVTSPVIKTSFPKEESLPVTTTSPPKTISPKTSPPVVISSPTTTNYKVVSKAYFYNEPDESTRRKAYIIHWNNSYANIKPLDEKNGFVYVVFTNHLNQTSKGWLRKKDLTEVNQ